MGAVFEVSGAVAVALFALIIVGYFFDTLSQYFPPWIEIIFGVACLFAALHIVKVVS